MKRKNGSSQVITKAYLNRALDERFGLYDKKMDERFKGIDERFKGIDERFRLFEISTDIKLDNLERRIDEKARQYRDQILTSNDKLAKTLETMREELEISNFQMRERIEDHEKRIKILESS